MFNFFLQLLKCQSNIPFQAEFRKKCPYNSLMYLIVLIAAFINQKRPVKAIQNKMVLMIGKVKFSASNVKYRYDQVGT